MRFTYYLTQLLWAGLILITVITTRFDWNAVLGASLSKGLEKDMNPRHHTYPLKSWGRMKYKEVYEFIPLNTGHFNVINPKLNLWSIILSSKHISCIGKWYHSPPTIPTRRLEVNLKYSPCSYIPIQLFTESW